MTYTRAHAPPRGQKEMAGSHHPLKPREGACTRDLLAAMARLISAVPFGEKYCIYGWNGGRRRRRRREGEGERRFRSEYVWVPLDSQIPIINNYSLPNPKALSLSLINLVITRNPSFLPIIFFVFVRLSSPTFASK
ncbi:hypothetical protein CRG98_027532, partial [Punica granatum]